jgi:hypothetical protein
MMRIIKLRQVEVVLVWAVVAIMLAEEAILRLVCKLIALEINHHRLARRTRWEAIPTIQNILLKLPPPLNCALHLLTHPLQVLHIMSNHHHILTCPQQAPSLQYNHYLRQQLDLWSSLLPESIPAVPTSAAGTPRLSLPPLVQFWCRNCVGLQTNTAISSNMKEPLGRTCLLPQHCPKM